MGNSALEQRKTIGERLLERIERRACGREPVVKSDFYEERYSRYARNRGVSRLGLSLFPSLSDGDIGVGAPQVGDIGGPSYLDGAPYWARLRRLGNARLRRSQWLAGLGDRFGQRSARALSRRWPGEAKTQMPSWLNPMGFSVDDVNFLVPDGAAPQVVEDVPQAVDAPKSAWTGAEISKSPWLTGRPFEPARVIRGSSRAARAARPLDRVGSTDVSPQIVRKIVETVQLAAATASRTGVAELVEEKVSSRAVARQVRRALKKHALGVSVAPPEVEAALPDDFLPSSSYATQRGRRRSGGGRRGLSPVTASSPMMSALMPSAPDGASYSADVHPRVPAFAAESGIVRRTAHREAASGRASASLSASPVRRPRSIGRAMRVGSVSDVLLAQPSMDGAETLESAPTARVAQRLPVAHSADVPTARSMDAMGLSAPVPARFSKAVRQPNGVYAPERTTLESEPLASRSEVTHTSEVQPSAGSSRSASTYAARRGVAEQTTGGTTLVPRPIRRDETVETPVHKPAAVRRASRVTRTPDGRFVPTPVVLATPEAAEHGPDTHPETGAGAVEPSSRATAAPRSTATAASRSTATAASRSTEEYRSEPSPVAEPTPARSAEEPTSSVGVTYAAQRLEIAREVQTEAVEAQRSLLPRVVPQRRVATDFVVPEHGPDVAQDTAPEGASTGDSRVVSQPETAGSSPTSKPRAQTSAAARAAARSHRTPLVGVSARRSIESTVGTESRVRGRRTRTTRGSALGYARPPAAPSLETISILVPPPQTDPGSTPDATTTATTPTTTTAPTIATAPTTATMASIQREFAAAPEQWVARHRPQVRGRPLDWSDARLEITSTPEVTTRSAHAPARVRTTAGGVYVPASVARRGATAKASVPTDDFTLPSAEDPSLGQISSQDASETPRASFDHTVQGVGTGAVNTAMPVWAQRSTGKPRISGADDLVSALSKASDTDEVMGVLMGQTANLSQVASSLPSPVVQVIQQIQTEAGRVADTAQQAASTENVASSQRGAAPHQRGAARSTTRVVRGFTGLRPNRSGGSSSAGMGKVSALAKRLQELIQLAENQKLSTARREVRMAEDSAAAKSEGQGPVAEEGGGQESALDVNALTQEVTEAVQRELEMRRERRLEDPNGRSIWWE